MRDRELIIAREATRKILGQKLREFCFSMICIACATLLMAFFTPETLPKASGLMVFLIGLVGGIVLGAWQQYNIFWDKMKTQWQRQHEKKINPHGDVESEIQTK